MLGKLISLFRRNKASERQMQEANEQDDPEIMEIVKHASVREYLDRKIESALAEKIEIYIKGINEEAAAYHLRFRFFAEVGNILNTTANKRSGLSHAPGCILCVGDNWRFAETGYYGEKIVLYLQTLGLNTCWVSSYHVPKERIEIGYREAVLCAIACGYGRTQGEPHKGKTFDEIAKIRTGTEYADWFLKGMEGVLLAPSPKNRQNYSFTYYADEGAMSCSYASNMNPAYDPEDALSAGIALFHFDLCCGKEMYYDPEEYGYRGDLLGNGDHRIPRDAYRPGKHIRPQLRFAMQRAGMSEEEYECTYIKRREGGDASDEADAWFGNTMEYRFTREYAWGCVDITVIAHYSMEDPDWWGDGYMISAWPEGFYDDEDEDSDDDVDDCVCFAYNEDYYTMEPGEQERIRTEAKAWAAQERKKAETEVRALLKKLEEEYEEIGRHHWNPATFEFID